jgi:hypothetical protein
LTVTVDDAIFEFVNDGKIVLVMTVGEAVLGSVDDSECEIVEALIGGQGNVGVDGTEIADCGVKEWTEDSKGATDGKGSVKGEETESVTAEDNRESKVEAQAGVGKGKDNG